MERETLLKLYTRLTSFVEKLPGGLQKPILRELVPIRETFLESRPARLLLIGHAQADALAFLSALGMNDLAPVGIVDNGWRTYAHCHLGKIELLDLRGGLAMPEGALARSQPDLAVWVQSGELTPEEEIAAAVRAISTCPPHVPLVGWSAEGTSAARASSLLAAEKAFASRGGRVFHDREIFAEEVCGLLPSPARLYFARLTAARRAQAHLAKSLLNSFSAVCGVIGLQPIPLADLPILTTLQTFMVALIIQTTGRRLSPSLVAEFFGALGINLGAGLLFREGARALIKIFPFWGNAVSGVVAGAGTYAIGRTAIAYFVEGLPKEEIRRLFSKLKPGKFTFGNSRELPDSSGNPQNSQ